MIKRLRIFPALLLCFLLVFETAPVIASGNNPYDGFAATDADEIHMASTASNTSSYIGGMWPGDWVCYKDLDFGSYAPYAVELLVGVPSQYAGSMEMRLDSASGPIIASWEITPSDWNTPVVQTAPITAPFTGVHDVYLLSTRNTGNIFSVQFYSPGDPNAFKFAVYDPTPAFLDIADNPHRGAIETVDALGLIEFDTSDGSFLPNLGVSRAEFADGICRVLGGASADINTSDVFADVGKNHRYAKSISVLKDRGVVRGSSANMFRPDEYITFAEAATMAVRALDYGNLAEHSGGYPGAYMNIAGSIGLFKGVTVGEYVSRGEFAEIIYNTIRADYLKADGVKDGAPYYKKNKGILEQTYGIYTGKGVVNANYLTSLYSAAPGVPKRGVVIDNITYDTGDTDAGAYLGMLCDYYYTEENGEYILEAILPCSNVKILEISDNDENSIINVSSDGIRYMPASAKKEKKIEFDNTINIIYNGVVTGKGADGTFSFDDFCGTIRLLDNGNGWETVIIEHPQNIIIGSVDPVNSSIRDKLTGDTIIMDDTGDYVEIVKEGKTAGIKKLAYDDVMEVKISRNTSGKKAIRAVVVGDNDVTATAVEVGDDYVVLDNGIKYSFAKEFSVELHPGMFGTFRLSNDGKIIDFRAEVEKGWSFGMFLGVASGGGLNQWLDVKLFNAEGKAVVYRFADNAVIDGLKFDSNEEAISGKKGYAGLNSVGLKSAVRYSLNSDGMITKLDTVLDGDKNADDTLKLLGGGGSYAYDYQNGLLFKSGEGKYSMSPAMATIAVLSNSDDEEYWKIGKPTDILRYPEWLFDNIDIYSSTGSEYEANFCIIAGMVDYDTEGNTYVVFDRMTTTAAADGEEYYAVHGCTNLGERTYFLPINDMNESGELGKIFNSVRRGDVLNIKVNNKNEIYQATYLVRYDLSSLPDGMKQPTLTKNSLSSGTTLMEERFVFGRVIERGDNGYLVVRYGDDDSARTEILVTGAGARVYKVADGRAGTMIASGLNVSNIAEGDIIFAAISRRQAVMCLVVPDMEM